ncbi:unnamed protein product [Lymnaea stagnalis]|uniref:Uncharacterized protein n=1 Tax=Lymnaea stagnalis TaxID=6523 RepID=A0AAV2HN47_LYMST
MAEKIPEPEDPPKEFQRSRMSSFKNFFRGSSKRKKRKSLEEAHENLRIDGTVIKRSSPVAIVVNQGASADDARESAEPEQHVIVSPGENDDLEELDLVEDSSFWKPRDFSFQRSHSTKSRLKPLLEDDDDLDTHVIARSYTDANLLSHYPAFLMRPLHAHRDASKEHGDKKKGSSASDDCGGGSHRRGVFSRRSHRAGDHAHAGSKHGRQAKGSHRDSLRRHVVQLLTRRKSKSGHATSQQSLHRGHSLASVELGSWAARGHRRGSALPPFCSSLSPTEASSRTEILQTISSAIIHLFQRKPLKDNELGVLQEHVRFLINSEAGGLVHEYYKDQLLRKGMIILREKIKNEQGLELLKQLGETWDYFFREILPVLQAILYPLSSSLSKEETVRSLSLLAFRNIVVLKVSVKEALDSVSKGDYPVNIPQMLLVLQSIQDNVFLSENQFLLEKLVARVVCPYMGQRGVYEGSPDPVIKVKLKPIPFNIPNVIVSDNDKYTSKAQYKLDNPTSPSPVVTRRGAFQDLSGLKKLKPVLEHIYDGGRRHSIMS